MILKPQDLLVTLKLLAGTGKHWTYPTLADSLGMSASEVHAAVKRAQVVQFLRLDAPLSQEPNTLAVREFLIHGAKYAFPGQFGPWGCGIPTSHSSSPIQEEYGASKGTVSLVWAHPEGTVNGHTVDPLYRSAPLAALRDPLLYEWLALLDAVRVGHPRERQIAIRIIDERLK
jgi:hypothetical protein